MRRLGHVPALDGVRGIAIAAVCGIHFFGLPGGAYGVDLFFVLSGFLITTLLLEERAATGRVSLGRFYRRRARRLFPALGFVLGFLVLIYAAFGHGRHGLGYVAWGGLYDANVVRAFVHPDPLAASSLDHLWSLAEEEQFYLFWPPLLLLALRRGISESRLFACVVSLGAAFVLYRIGLTVAGASSSRLYFGPDTHAEGLIFGCALAFARRRGVRLPADLGWVGLAGFVTLCGLGAGGEWAALGLLGAELAGALIVLAAVDGRCTKVLCWRPLAWLGLISYSLYLWHQPVRVLVPGHKPAVELPIAVVFALVSYYYVEARFRGERSQMVRSRRPTRAPFARVVPVSEPVTCIPVPMSGSGLSAPQRGR